MSTTKGNVTNRNKNSHISELDYTIADNVLNLLLYNEKYKSKNLLFIEPFDINEVPDYLTIVGPPLDIRTVADRFYNTTNNEATTYYYTAINDFWNDLYKVYHNAIQYHTSNKSTSKWIAKYAKDMIKIINKERKNIEMKLVSSVSNNASTTTTNNNNNNTNDASTIDGGNTNKNSADTIFNETNVQSKPKTKLKLPLPTSSSHTTTTGPSSSSSSSLSNNIPMDVLSNETTTPSASSSSMNNSNHNVSSPTKRFKLQLKITKKTSSAASNHDNDNMNHNNNNNNNISSSTQQEQTKLKLKLSISKNNNKNKNSNKQALHIDTDVIMEDGEVMTNSTTPTVVGGSSSSSSNNHNNSSTTQKVKVSTPRGKELPQGVVMTHTTSTTTIASSSTTTTTNSKKSSNSKKSKKLPTTISSSTTPTADTNNNSNITMTSTSPGLDAFQKKQCYKVLLGLKRRKNKQIYWFLTPVSDKNILLDYKSKIKYPMDLQTIQQKLLEKDMYKKIDAFVLDLRRVFANALRYNTSIKDSLRPLAVEGLQCAEQLMIMFLMRHFSNTTSNNTSSSNSNNQSMGNNNNNSSSNNNNAPCYTPLLYCWNVCINILDTLYNLVNPIDGQPMAYYFLHPVSVYCGGKFPPDYLDLVKKPMDFGTITANLIEGKYQTIESFSNDCRLVVQNCQTYYQGKEESRVFLEQAMRLNECLSTQLSQLARYDKSMKGESERRKLIQMNNPIRITQEMILPNQPPIALFLNIIEEMRTLKYTDKGTKITESAMSPYEKPVSIVDYPDYLHYVSDPIDLQTIERKVKLNDYETPEDFEYDMNLMFKNCEVYNLRRNAQHPVAMSKFALRKFRTIFYSKIQAYEDPLSVVTDAIPAAVPSSSQQSTTDDDRGSGTTPNKKVKIDVNALLSSSKGKTAPRISLSISPTAGAAASSTTGRAKSPATVPHTSSTSSLSQRQVQILPKPKIDAPVPLHIAIAKVKEAFPLRRTVKSLQIWEADCARYHKELMRHPWISAARPKFVFSCPVPILFPELGDIYAAKIRRPMDLTTVECTLLAGNRYAGPEDFIQDIALVFANAIRFNKDGKDIGDPLSCAYYDASVHLLKYSRWLSLDLLANYIDTSDHKDEPSSDGLPPFSWKLTTGNKQVARKELEDLVLNEPIEKSLEGDRYTWMEAECEKLLKALRHQSDLRYMSFFIQPNYPVDYTAFISKPMDWERVQRTLKKRHYDTIGALISDLRLIFSNAEKYNSRLKGTDTVSGLAYEAAKIMSNKLEIAINKLLLTVSDRLERERIDHANAEREIEAAERAEEAEIRAAWSKQEQTLDKDGATTGSSSLSIQQSNSTRVELLHRTRLVRRLPQRRGATDFEVPFFDNDDTDRNRYNNNSRSIGDNEFVKLQKAMFEKQRYQLNKMRTVSASIGADVFRRCLERQVIDNDEFRRRQQMLESTKSATSSATAQPGNDPNKSLHANDGDKPSSVLKELEKEGRNPLQIKILPIKKTTKKRPAASLPEGFD
jgi:hypothetical protein